MLISIKKKFCYIANTKVASTSLEHVLESVSEIKLNYTSGLKHMPLLSFKEYLEKVFSGEIKYIARGQAWRFEADRFEMDELICLENMGEKLEDLSKKLNMPLELPRLNVSTEKRKRY